MFSIGQKIRWVGGKKGRKPRRPNRWSANSFDAPKTARTRTAGGRSLNSEKRYLPLRSGTAPATAERPPLARSWANRSRAAANSVSSTSQSECRISSSASKPIVARSWPKRISGHSSRTSASRASIAALRSLVFILCPQSEGCGLSAGAASRVPRPEPWFQATIWYHNTLHEAVGEEPPIESRAITTIASGYVKAERAVVLFGGCQEAAVAKLARRRGRHHESQQGLGLGGRTGIFQHGRAIFGDHRRGPGPKHDSHAAGHRGIAAIDQPRVGPAGVQNR